MPSATIIRSGSHGEEEFHSVAGSPFLPPDGHNDVDEDAVGSQAPLHPVKMLQASFEESIIESADDHDADESATGSAESRRQTLLEAKKYDETWQTRWKQRATSRYHPLLKLISQIVFGMHLLQQQQAKSEGEVVKILQAHVNEVDTFLEKTAEDFDLANNDIQERIRHLKLPMEHKEVFEMMLDDKKFRSQLLDGNDKIESIIDRTTKAMDASLYDLNEGIKANGELGKYLDGVSGKWPKDKRVISEVFGAMRGNEQGWTRYAADLQLKAKTLKQNLAQLATLLAEMSRMAAVASRRNVSQRTRTTGSVGSKSAPTSPGLRSKFPEEDAPPMPSSPPRSVRSTKSSKSLKDVNKPLPRDPLGGTSKPKQSAMPITDRFERPRQSPLSPDASKAPARPSAQLERPRTAGGGSSKKAREADHRENTADLVAFFKQGGNAPQNPQQSTPHLNPLRSNPPDDDWAELERSRSQPNGHAGSHAGRSPSQGAIDILKGAEQARSLMGLKPRESTSTNRTSSDQGGDKKSNLVGTGFARRLSKRMKHLPSKEEEAVLMAAAKEKGEPYPDSAYASGPESQSANSTDRKPSRPDSFIAPLPPKTMEPLYTSRVTSHGQTPSQSSRSTLANLPLPQQQQQPGPNHKEFMGEEFGAQSVRSLAPTSKSRGSAIKSVFQRKWSSGKKMFVQKEIWNNVQ